MMKFTDLHHHCLWGMDDGPRDFEESCRMLKLAAEDGITTVAATVHVYPGQILFDRGEYLLRLEALRQWVKAESLPLTILEGGEIWYTNMTLSMLREGRIPTIGATPYVLMEFSPKVTWDFFEQAVQEMFRGGYIPILAHIERYRKLYGHFNRLLRLHGEIDVCFQVNTASVVAPGDLAQRIFLKRLFRAEAVDLVATDAHDLTHRSCNMGAAFTYLEKQYGREYAAALTDFRPEAHLEKLCNG